MRELAFLGDDSYISLRYAENLANGRGLVFNEGERVEGYSNFLWVLLLAFVQVLGVAPPFFAKWGGALFSIVLLATMVRPALGARTGVRQILIFVAPILLASNRTFCAWSSGGLGESLHALLMWLAISELARSDSMKKAAVWGGLAAWMRPEAVGFFPVLFGLRLLLEPHAQGHKLSLRLKSALLDFMPFVTMVGAHLLFRIVYYGDVVPNTFYVKVGSFWPEQGQRYLLAFAQQHALLVLAPLVLIGLFSSRDRRSALLVALVVLQSAYLFWIGGDRFEFRLCLVMLPPLAFLIQAGIVATTQWISQWARPSLALSGSAILGFGALLCFALPMWNPITLPRGVASIDGIESYGDRRASEGQALREWVEQGLLPRDTVLGLSGIGAVSYYSGLRIVDIHGLVDREVARMPTKERGTVGHEKVATVDYLKSRGVHILDVRNRLIAPEFLEQQDFTKTDRGRVWIHAPLCQAKAKGHVLTFVSLEAERDLRERFSSFELPHSCVLRD